MGLDGLNLKSFAAEQLSVKIQRFEMYGEASRANRIDVTHYNHHPNNGDTASLEMLSSYLYSADH